MIAGGVGVPIPLRTKDRVTTPLSSGYRDVLMNITFPDMEGLVCELQLHFYEVCKIKPNAHVLRCPATTRHPAAALRLCEIGEEKGPGCPKQVDEPGCSMQCERGSN